jgi:hypothetical protein
MTFVSLRYPSVIAVAKNGIKVVKSVGEYGEKVISSFKGDATTPFKQVITKASKQIDVPHHTGTLFGLNIDNLYTKIIEAGKPNIEIYASKDHWSYAGKPLKTVIRSLKTQQGKPDIEVLGTIYHNQAGNLAGKSNYTSFSNTEIIKSVYKQV